MRRNLVADARIVPAFLPHLLTASRLAAAPLLFFLILSSQLTAAAILLGAVMLSDFADGALARRFGAPTRAGAFADVWADFSIVLAAFSGLALIGTLPYWLLVPIVLSFLLFLLTARRRSVIYDPFGRYIGVFLMVMALLVVVVRDGVLDQTVVWSSVIACGYAMLGRIASLIGGK